MKKILLTFIFGFFSTLLFNTYAQDCIDDNYDVLQPYKSAVFTSESYTRISSSDTGTMQDFLHSDFTMDFWIKPAWGTSSTDWQHIFNYGEWDDDFNSLQVVFEPISSGWQIRVTDGNDSGSNYDLIYEMTDDEFTDNFNNKWVHIAVTADFDTTATETCELELFVNGESKETQADFLLEKYESTNANYSNQQYCYLGNSTINNNNETFLGYLAAFRIWTSVLSTTQINYVKDKMFETSNTFNSSYTSLAPNLLVNMIRSRTNDNIYSRGNTDTIGMVEVDVAGNDLFLYPNAPAKPYNLESTLTVPYNVELNWDNDVNGGTTYVYGKWSTENDSAYELLCRTNTTSYSHTFIESELGTYTFKILNAWHNYSALGALLGASNGYTYSESETINVSVEGYTYVPDNNFEQALIDLGYDTVLDDYVLTDNINTITSLDVASKSISDLTGIEDFPALTYLRLSYNNLTTLDVSNSIALEKLYCGTNALTSLDVSANTALVNFYCDTNALTSVDVSANTALINFRCDANSLTNLDVSSNTALTTLDCSSNAITNLDVSSNTALTSLNSFDNQLTSLDVSANVALITLDCSSNNLTSLDLKANTSLTELYCFSNQLTSLDVSSNTALTTLNCSSNDLTSINVANGNNINVTSFKATNNPNLTCIQVDDAEYSTTNWTSIDATSSFSEDCHYGETYVPDDNFEQALIDLGYDTVLDDYVLTENINSLTYLNISSKNITDLTGIEDFTALTTLYCYSNNLTTLDVSNSIALEKLYCSTNSLTSLDVSSNTALTILSCSLNALTSLDVNSNTALTHLYCSSNVLTSLDVNSNTALTLLRCSSNALTSLNVANGNNSNFYYAFGDAFSATNNPNLTCIQVDDAEWSTTNWTNINATASFSEDCRYDYTYVPDDNFEQALIDLGYDTVLDDYVLTENISSLTSLNVSSKSIADLTGIEDFIGLKILDCSSNNLTSIDVSENTALTYLDCESNKLTGLEVANGNNSNFSEFKATTNPNLTCIEVDDAEWSTTNWTNIDTTASFSEDCHFDDTYVPDDNFEQVLIDLGYDAILDDYVLTENINSLTHLDVPSMDISDLTGIEDFIALKYLYCSYNALTSLDVSSNTALETLYCYSNELTSLDVSSNTALETLYCYSNELTSLDVSANTALTSLDCSSNDLISINVANGNNINVTSFKATNNPNLTCIQVDDAEWSTTNWTNIDDTASFSEDCHFDDTFVPDDNFEQALINLGYDDVLNDYVLTENINTITYLYVVDKGINDLTGIEDFVALEELHCRNNNLTSLDVSSNTSLTYLTCRDNNLTSLDVSKNLLLEKLTCSANYFESLDVSLNTKLTWLYCHDNILKRLNVANGNNTSFTVFQANNNPNLTCIEVDDAEWSTTNWTNIDDTASFSEDCHFDDTYVPDDNFEQALIDLGYDAILDDYVLTENINTLTTLNVSSKGISDLTGIEDFTALTRLYCSSNELTNLDVSSNTALTNLNCYSNDLTSLDVSSNMALTNLNCYSNDLTSLDVSSNTALTTLSCSSNNLTSLDVNSNTALTTLSCSSNELTSLDVSSNTALTSLTCSSNNLTSLDVSENVALTTFYCYSNALTSLDVSSNTALTKLSCYSNNLTSLNVANGNNSSFYDAYGDAFKATNNPNLTCIQVDDAEWSTTNWTSIDTTASFSEDCHFDDTYVPDDNFEQALIDLGYDAILDNYVLTENISSLTSLDVSSKHITDLTGIEDFTALTTLYCYLNNLTSIDVSFNTALTNLSCYANTLTSIDVSSNTALTALSCSSNDLTSLDVSSNSALTSLTCYSNELTSLDVSVNTVLTNLNCSSNELTSLDVSENTALTYLYCYSNDLTSLDVSSNTALTTLSCSSNNLTSLDVNSNTALTTLSCSSNELTSLDVSSNTALTSLTCSSNNLTSLDVSSNTALTTLSCSSNNLTSIDVSSNTALTILECSSSNLTSLNVANGNNSNFFHSELGGYSFDATNNPNLTCIQVDDADWSTNNWTSIDATASFSEDCHYSETYVPDDNFEQALIDLGYDTVLDDYVLTENINSLTSLDVSSKSIADLTGIEDFIGLNLLDCSSNNLTRLDVSSNTALTFLECSSNDLTRLNVANGSNSHFSEFKATTNPNLTCIQVDDAAWSSTNWTNIDATASFNEHCFSTYVPDDNFEQTLIDLGYDAILDNYVLTENISSLTSLDVYYKSISDLTGIEDFTALTYLNCAYNNLTSLDVSSNTALTTLYCYSNSLTSLDVSANTALTYLDCESNELTSLDVSSNTALTRLYCSSNNLTSLNLANGNNVNFTRLWAYSNPDLTCIQVDDAEWSTTNWTDKDATASFSEDCSSTLATDNYEIENFKVYPNPSNGDVYISVSEEAAYQLVNLTGQIVKQGKLVNGVNNLNLTGFNKGIYFVKIKTDNAIHTEKLIFK